MNKTYTLLKKELTETTRNRANIDYYLIDNAGNKRVVKAVAQLGFAKKVKSVYAKYYRETALVNALAQAKSQQQILVSYPRFKKQAQVTLLDEQQESALSSGSLASNHAAVKHILPAPDFITIGLFALSAYLLWMFVSL